MNRPTLHAILATIAVLTLAALGCGSTQSGDKIATKQTGDQPTPAQLQTYAPGDVIQVQDHTITLNTCELAGDRIVANFTIENKGAEDLNVSSMLSFTAKDDEGSKLTQDVIDCTPALGGKILPGDKLKGNICWKAPGLAHAKLYYEASLFGSGAIVWDVGQ